MSQVFKILLISSLCIMSGCQKKQVSEPTTVIVFAAASTSSVIEEAASLFEEETGLDVVINTASSGTLARQIEMGAEADIFISASEEWVDYLQERGYEQERSLLFSNDLVLITPFPSKSGTYPDVSGFTADGLLNVFQSSILAIGDPEHVPAGRYAKEFLDYYRLYGECGELISAANVSSVLRLVELGEADLGIVYHTDALLSDSVRVLGKIPGESHSPINYYCLMLNEGSATGKTFFDFLTNSRKAQDLYRQWGFNNNH